LKSFYGHSKTETNCAAVLKGFLVPVNVDVDDHYDGYDDHSYCFDNVLMLIVLDVSVPWINDKSQNKTELLGGKLPHCHFVQKFHIGSHEDKLETFMGKDHG